jgi:hypothetical protein
MRSNLQINACIVESLPVSGLIIGINLYELIELDFSIFSMGGAVPGE